MRILPAMIGYETMGHCYLVEDGDKFAFFAWVNNTVMPTPYHNCCDFCTIPESFHYSKYVDSNHEYLRLAAHFIRAKVRGLI